LTTPPTNGLIVSSADAPVTVIAGRSDAGSAVIVAAPVTTSDFVWAFHVAAPAAALSHAGRLVMAMSSKAMPSWPLGLPLISNRPYCWNEYACRRPA
jgi:hypothetical protein